MPAGQTAGDLIRDSMKLLGLLGTGETATAAEMVDGLNALNDLIEQWSLQNLAVYGTVTQSFSTVANTASYTIGPTGTWAATARPVRINGPAICTYQGANFPVEIIGQQDYDIIPMPSQTSEIVQRILFVNDYPNGRITLWPVPSVVSTITLNIDRVLTSVAAQTTTMLYPPGYLVAMRYNLAIMLASTYGRPIPTEVAGIAQNTFANLKRANKKRRTAKYDAMLVGGMSDYWQRGY